ncbi:hypothetical protein P0082_00125 [Candidatus Haliotispira prima]|uniref:Uncharacterized protein n=1 Tax=Candidatus Haliotispira prima TaxID=3034016 RepID=A0ABY8MH09_9SPIO|nr:hypothetical protein P0082_00125 [Candidatus Haliotispira prima]
MRDLDKLDRNTVQYPISNIQYPISNSLMNGIFGNTIIFSPKNYFPYPFSPVLLFLCFSFYF